MNDYVDALIHDEMTLEACEYKNRSSSTVVINTKTLSTYMYIHLPVECVHLDLFEISQVTAESSSSEDVEVIGKNDIIKYKDHPWVRIKSKLLDWFPGKHVYKLRFEVPHQINTNSVDYYISYVSQEDNPEKPYVYMRR